MNDELIEEGCLQQPHNQQDSHLQLKGKKFYLITTMILVGSYLFAISISSLARVLAIVGATGSTSISFILPGIFGFYLIGSELPANHKLPLKTCLLKYLALALSIWGITVMVACLTATFKNGASH